MQGKKILLAITGSIAAYKAASLTRLLIKAGAEVQVLDDPSRHLLHLPADPLHLS